MQLLETLAVSEHVRANIDDDSISIVNLPLHQDCCIHVCNIMLYVQLFVTSSLT